MRNGSASVSECEAPLLSVSGATIQTSSVIVGGDLLEYGNAAGADAVVVGDENAHGCRLPSRTCEPRFRPRDRT